jgi:hypothetical protein
MNIDINHIRNYLSRVMKKLGHFMPFLFIITNLVLYGYLVIHINNLTQVEADELTVLEQLESANRPEIDKAAVDKIRELQDQNVQVDALFKEARDNPFSE